MEIELKDEVYRLRPLIFGATKKAMKHHVMGCLEDGSLGTILLHHGTNDLRSEESAEKIASNIINVTLSAKNKKTLFVFQNK